MIATLLLGIISVLLAYLAQFKNCEFLLKVAFFIIFLFLAVRFEFGNDYDSYLDGFYEINKFKRINFFSEEYHFEPGWLLLNRIFQPLGFFSLIIFISAFVSFTYYRFIERFVPKNYYWLSLLIFVFNPSFLLVQSSAMRQTVAICLFLYSIKFIIERKLFFYVLTISLASFFHESALILLPVYFLGKWDWKIKNSHAFIIIIVYIAFFFLVGPLMTIINQITLAYFPDYLNYEKSGSINSGFGVFYNSVFLILLLLNQRKLEQEASLILKIAIASFFFIPLSLGVQLISRVGMYFIPAIIVAYPLIFSSFKKNIIYQGLFAGLVVFITFFSFYNFFDSEVYGESFKNYKTIFSSYLWK